MRTVKTRDGGKKHAPYPINEFPAEVIESIGKQIVHLKAVGQPDMSGDQFNGIFADSIGGTPYAQPLGIADVKWQDCCWSVKTVQAKSPHTATNLRLISGRNSPAYSSGITDPFADVQATGQSVLDVYNQRIAKVTEDYKEVRLVVLVRNMAGLEFTIFERPISPLVVNVYKWTVNQNRNLCGWSGKKQVFTWQPHGSQFTIHEFVPSAATKFRITQQPGSVPMESILDAIGFTTDWVEIL